jgi:hypothetical protein
MADGLEKLYALQVYRKDPAPLPVSERMAKILAQFSVCCAGGVARAEEP